MFEKIQDKWKDERGNEKLTPMDEIFYSAMRELLKKRSTKTKKEINPLIKKILETRLERIKYIINDLMRIRTTKLIAIVMNREKVTVNLAREEQDFYDRFSQIYELYRKEVFSPKDVAYVDINKLIGKEIEEEVEEEIEYVAIRFVKKTKTQIQGLDGKTYGPFEPEDVCLIPKENAIGLVRREIAENIEM
ncbi:MAG: DNA replication complex subunit Gins51 [Candidatus Heimdallarchaeaceae archaeon]